MGGICITFGPRIVKTGLAVSLSIYLCLIFGFENSVFAGVAAILAVQPSVYRTWKQLSDQVMANTLGASISLFFIYYFGDNPITIGLVIIFMISLSLKLKMEKTIPLTLVTVLAIMSASGSEDFYFALERFLVILIGTSSAILVNLILFPPNYKKNYIQGVQSAFQNMSLLLRTAISNELTETSFKELTRNFNKELINLENQYKLFDEERVKLGKSKRLNAREIIILKQMLKALQEGYQLLENIDEHYFPSISGEWENQLFDQQIEELIKYHEYLLLKYLGKIKKFQPSEGDDGLNSIAHFYDQVIELYQTNKEQKLRLTIIASSIVDYSFHLNRLDQLLNYSPHNF